MKVGDKFKNKWGDQWEVVAVYPESDRVYARSEGRTATGALFYQFAYWDGPELLAAGVELSKPAAPAKPGHEHDWRTYDSGFPGSRAVRYCWTCNAEDGK